MSANAPQYPVKAFFLAWLLAVAVCALVCVWGFAVLRGGPPGLSGAAGVADGEAEAPALALPAPEIPAFDPQGAEYLITAFSLQGVRQIGDGEPLLSLLPPGNALTAQVIRRDSSPELLTGGAVVEFSLDAPYAGENARAASGSLEPGKDAEGKVAPFFSASDIPLSPYAKDGSSLPYPTARVTARDSKGALLAQSAVVLPVSAESGCRNCHTGPWKRAGAGGISARTAGDILAVHDRRNGTRLAEDAQKGTAADCASCHSGNGDRPNLSTAVHGFHATMKLPEAEACGLCHASAEKGRTRFFRGLHATLGFDCAACHGVMEDHALSLLRFEAERGAASSKVRLAQLTPRAVAETEAIKARAPGVNLPHCAGCHDFQEKPDPSTATAFNKWTDKAEERFSRAFDNTGTLRCPSCHGAPHAVYPASSPAGDERDNLQPLQYQKMAAPLGQDNNCAVCHVTAMEGFVHHDRVGE